jgi:hypothetical protein
MWLDFYVSMIRGRILSSDKGVRHTIINVISLNMSMIYVTEFIIIIVLQFCKKLTVFLFLNCMEYGLWV